MYESQMASALPKEGFVRLPTVLRCVEVSRSTLWLWVKEGKFPAPTKLSPRITAWDAQCVRSWIDARKSERVKTA